MIKRLTLLFAAALSLTAYAEPKKLLLVTVTTGFRHSSIETAEKVLAELGAKSGAFTVDYVHQPEGQPKNPGKAPVRGEKETEESFKAKAEAFSKASADFNEANKIWNDKITAYMADKMALDKIKGYDGFVFANTTGDLLLPDREGFIKLIEGGKAFIAMHSGSDTYHPFRGYIDMLGGEFETHKSQVEIQPVVHDPAHPITKGVPLGWKVFDEIYIIKSFDKAKVHGLLGLNSHPNLEQMKAEAAQRKEKKIEDPKKDQELKDAEVRGYCPVAWCKELGAGRVYYNSLGHREDVWDPTWKADTKDRKNSPEIAQTYQEMILAGIKWALKLEEGVSTPGNIP
ncbi:ThuA domain-containing protein [Prosthecobacter sp.]|uniref:ThuA domain-containing protein n=1 Tax=Prosthecobacter sp. TaxID=1965333 RepID=UPI00248A6A8C|nr:ThuA domain-containing protein [Prosthecobacter sp.]MDI1315179.1 ThuA domain-containing protein [Prosthecobacter sp.]